jgi:hypothetical protein
MKEIIYKKDFVEESLNLHTDAIIKFKKHKRFHNQSDQVYTSLIKCLEESYKIKIDKDRGYKIFSAKKNNQIVLEGSYGPKPEIPGEIRELYIKIFQGLEYEQE